VVRSLGRHGGNGSFVDTVGLYAFKMTSPGARERKISWEHCPPIGVGMARAPVPPPPRFQRLWTSPAVLVEKGNGTATDTVGCDGVDNS